ncbi:serine hydrolase domain-containing protein [Parahaliea maris]|uniref:serine hydrolase domain-containing protein n=1 Tax=Parahaliea maris TaxID=2716870 RepID=UPI00164F4F0A|nr:serine hydrolase domain-containing protein [Parahaliea maris]
MTNKLKEFESGLVRGRYYANFEAVAEAFADNLQNREDKGAAFALYHHGEPVVDIWGGFADASTGKPWQENTVALMFSAAKGLTATCLLRLVDAGQLDIDLPICHYWPEFAANGKADITTRMVLAHRAGLAAVEGELTLAEILNWDPVVGAIAAQAPNWEPDSTHGYHARSFGWILGELLRRITGETLGSFLNREIAAVAGLRLWIGLPKDELPHCARIIPPAGNANAAAEILGENSLTARVMSGPNKQFGYNDMWNRAEILQAEMPSSNGVGDARSMARFYAALNGDIAGLPTLSPALLETARTVQSRGPDAVILHDTCFGLGYSLQPMVAPGAGPNCYGHPGAGGTTAFADPDNGVAMAYLTNTMRFDPEGDPRSANLIQAAYQSLASTGGQAPGFFG